MSPPRPPPFLEQAGVRVMWLSQLAGAGLRPRVLRGTSRTDKRCWVVRVRLDATALGIGVVLATLRFPRHRPEAVSVHVTGPTDSKHRYADGSLCMWFPGDDAARRWTRRDGPVALVAHVIAHLAREEWWRRTGDWVGEEAPHELAEGHP